MLVNPGEWICMKFTEIEAIVLDMDGVLWRGEEPLPGLIELFQWLDESETPYVLATNNSSKTQADYVNKLVRMGVTSVPETRIITSGMATAMYLQKVYPAGTHVYVFGMDGLRKTMEAAGFETGDADGVPAVVVAGIHFGVTYEDLKRATLYLRAGARLVGTNPDVTYPSPEGQAPGAGSFVAALEAAGGTKATIIGKPDRPMFETALEIVGKPAGSTLMVGDRLATDILGAQQVGMKTALVLSGVTNRETLSSSANDIWPDVAFDGLPELLTAWAGFEWYNLKLKAKRQANR